MTINKVKSVPKALHMYNIEYTNGDQKVIYACGMTNAHFTSREYWPELEVLNICQLDDSWKN
jgi:hypothetical protein